jgi:hypothetical protein
MGLTDLTALCGAILGTAGFALSTANYFRDRPSLRVTLKFDLEGYGSQANSGTWAVVSIANTGRRPIYVSHVGLSQASRWNRSKSRTLFLWDSAGGRRLQEGDAPWTLPINQDIGVTTFVRRYGRVRAFVTDSAGRICYSSAGLPLSG